MIKDDYMVYSVNLNHFKYINLYLDVKNNSLIYADVYTEIIVECVDKQTRFHADDPINNLDHHYMKKFSVALLSKYAIKSINWINTYASMNGLTILNTHYSNLSTVNNITIPQIPIDKNTFTKIKKIIAFV